MNSNEYHWISVFCSEVAGEDGVYGSQTGASGASAASGAMMPNQMYHSHSNPDLTSICYDDPRADYPEHVLKVFKADQTCKYLLIHKVRHPSFVFFRPNNSKIFTWKIYNGTDFYTFSFILTFGMCENNILTSFHAFWRSKTKFLTYFDILNLKNQIFNTLWPHYNTFFDQFWHILTF